MATFLGDEPSAIELNFPAIAEKLATIVPVAATVSRKTFQNIRSNFIYAVQASGLMPVQRWAKKAPLLPEWLRVLEVLPDKRSRIVFSRLGRYASGRGLGPQAVDDEFIDEFMNYVRQGSLYANQNPMHRLATITWNKVARGQPALDLKLLSVPSFRRASPRLKPGELSEQFRADLEAYLGWCAQADIMDEHARDRALAPASVQNVRNLMIYAVSALIKSGIDAKCVNGLADLVSPDSFRRIARWRHQNCAHQSSATFYVAYSLVQAAQDWVKVDPSSLAELKRLLKRLPRPEAAMSARNKARLRQFDDALIKQNFLSLPERLWREVQREQHPTWRTLDLAQCAIAIGLLTYIPLRRKTLCALEFGRHVHLRENPGSMSTIEIAEEELKAGDDLAFDIPSDIARMLLQYRNVIAPKVIGRRPTHVFVNARGRPKRLLKVSMMIKRCLWRHTGIDLHVHGFRHLHGKLVLDKEPGAYETVRQVLGHKNLETTRRFYTGIDSRRAARHHQNLIDKLRGNGRPMPRSRRGRAPEK
jgi:integrase